MTTATQTKASAQPQATKKPRIYVYEAMFLVGQAQSADLAATLAHIDEIMSRGHATLIAMKKFTEGRLAYEINGQKRGLYILAYFKAPNDQLSHIERDCNLSEKLLRTLIVRCDHMTMEQIEASNGRAELLTEAKLRAERPQHPAGEAPAAPKAPASDQPTGDQS